jgi:hypothetical protein
LNLRDSQMRFMTLTRTLLTILLGSSLSLAQQTNTTPTSLKGMSGSAVYGKLPLTFEANRGQTHGEVNFISRGKGYTASLTAGGMVLSLRTGSVAKQPSASGRTSTTLQFRLLGASKNPVAVGEDPQVGKVNYFMGSDPAQWHTNVPTFGRVRYRNVYPGIDLIYYGNHRQLEYDFAVSPGADPRQIQFEIKGARELALDGEGNLVLSTGNGELHFQSPIVYQESKGRRVAVEGGYAMTDSTHIGFQVAHYDSTKALVIDPVLLYSTYLGGSGSDQPTSIAVDGSGSVYIAGYTDLASFQTTTLGTPSPNTDHVFIAKLDPTGSNLIYADYIGGNSYDYGLALALDSAKEVYVTGSTQSSNFPVVNAYQSQQPGPYTGFLTKVSADGSSLLYSTYLGGNNSDQPSGIAIDNLGDVYVAGYTQSQNFPVANAYQATALPNQGGVYGTYGFLTKFDPSGSSLVYSTYFAGNTNVAEGCCWPAPYNSISTVTVDASGNAYVAGMTNTYNFPATTGSFLANNSTQGNATVGFVSKFSSSGALDYSTYFYGSSGAPIGIAAIAVDSNGSAYITGSGNSDGTFPITSTSICDPETYGLGCGYAFVTKFDPSGATLLYSTFLGPNNYATPQAIALDTNNDVYVLASTTSSTFNGANAIETYAGGNDLLVAEIDPVGSTQLFATYLGGSQDDQAAGIAVDRDGNIYVAGSTDSNDFPVTSGAFQTVAGGNTDAFIAKIGPESAPAITLTAYSLQFASQPVGTTSQPQTVLLRNMGNASLVISSITATGDFSEFDNCGTSVPAAGSCILSVSFSPTSGGVRNGSVLLRSDAAGSPHSVTLSGTGLGPGASLNPSTLGFADQPIGTSSSAQALTLTNSGNATLNIGSIQLTGDYLQTNNCPAQLQSGASCSINVTFTPKATGTRNGTLTISDNGFNSQQSVSLTGSGSDFSVHGSPTDNTISSGATATYILSVSPIGGSFNHSVSFSCTGLPAQATCTFSPAVVNPGGTGSSTKLSISTVSQAARALPSLPSHSSPVYATLMNLNGLGLVGVVLAGSRKRSKRLVIFMLLAVLVVGMVFMTGCAGGTGIGGGSKTPSSTTYTVTVTGMYGALQHSLPLTLTVQ